MKEEVLQEHDDVSLSSLTIDVYGREGPPYHFQQQQQQQLEQQIQHPSPLFKQQVL